MGQIIRDLSYGWRSLLKAPTFTVVVSILLAVGIGVNGAVLSIIDTSVLRKLPVPNPHRIVAVRSGDARDVGRSTTVASSFGDARDIALNLRDVGDFGAYTMTTVKLGGDLAGNTAFAALITGSYFELLNAPPAIGRVIARDEESPANGNAVAVISNHLWQTLFDGDPRVVGRRVTIEATRFTIVGVMPPRFTGTHAEGRTDIWIPVGAATRASAFTNRQERIATIIGRLADGVTLPAVQGRLDALARDLAGRYPLTEANLRLRVVGHSRLVADDEGKNALPTTLLVWAMVATLHFVACVNIAMLMLARASGRRRELGIRLCLGASRWRIASLTLSESILLATIGATGGIVLARWLISLMCRMQFLSAMDAGLDLRLAILIALLGAATVLQFGVIPARHAATRTQWS